MEVLGLTPERLLRMKKDKLSGSWISRPGEGELAVAPGGGRADECPTLRRPPHGEMQEEQLKRKIQNSVIRRGEL